MLLLWAYLIDLLTCNHQTSPLKIIGYNIPASPWFQYPLIYCPVLGYVYTASNEFSSAWKFVRFGVRSTRNHLNSRLVHFSLNLSHLLNVKHWQYSHWNVLAMDVCTVRINFEKLAYRQNSECLNADFWPIRRIGLSWNFKVLRWINLNESFRHFYIHYEDYVRRF